MLPHQATTGKSAPQRPFRPPATTAATSPAPSCLTEKLGNTSITERTNCLPRSRPLSYSGGDVDIRASDGPETNQPIVVMGEFLLTDDDRQATGLPGVVKLRRVANPESVRASYEVELQPSLGVLLQRPGAAVGSVWP